MSEPVSPDPTRRPSRTRRTVTAMFAALALGSAALGAAYVISHHTLTIEVDGEQHRLLTRAETVAQALDDAGVTLLPKDSVWPPLDAEIGNGDHITIHRATVVALQVDGGFEQVRTQRSAPLDVLAEEGITLAAQDVVQVNGQAYTLGGLQQTAWQEPVETLRIVRSTPLTLLDGGEARVIDTTQPTVGLALASAGVELYLADRITPDPATRVARDMVVTIERSVPLTIVADGQRLESRALGPTVGDALASIGLAPIGLDYTVPALDTLLSPGMTIRLVRVTEEVVTKEEPIPFTTIYRADTNLPAAEKQVVQEGTDGVRLRYVRVRFEDGEEVARVMQAEFVAQLPKPRLIHFGKMTP